MKLSSVNKDIFSKSKKEPEEVKVVPMDEDDFNDPEENRNEFETPKFTSQWLQNEKQTFREIRDKNNDGYLGLTVLLSNQIHSI